MRKIFENFVDSAYHLLYGNYPLAEKEPHYGRKKVLALFFPVSTAIGIAMAAHVKAYDVTSAVAASSIFNYLILRIVNSNYEGHLRYPTLDSFISQASQLE